MGMGARVMRMLGLGALAVGGALIVVVGTVLARERSVIQATPPPNGQSASARATFGIDANQLIERYNAGMKSVDRSMLLPPASAMEDGGSNPRFFALRHEVAPGAFVTIEVDRASGKAFSFLLWAAPDEKPTSPARSFVLLSGVAATMLGQDGQAKALLDLCSQAVKPGAQPQTQLIAQLKMHCAFAQGMLIAGFSAP